MALPGPDDERNVPRVERPVALIAVLGGGVCLLAVVICLGLIGLSGKDEQALGQDAITALATIGGALASGFSAWIGNRVGAQQGYREGVADARDDS